MRHFPLGFHKDAGPAARATQAAQRQGKAWALADIMFAKYRALKPDNIESYAGEVGLDLDKFKTDLASDGIKNEVDSDMKAARQAGVRGTPSIFVNGMQYRGQRNVAGFKKVVEQELKKADALIKKGTPINQVYEKLSKSKS